MGPGCTSCSSCQPHAPGMCILEITHSHQLTSKIASSMVGVKYHPSAFLQPHSHDPALAPPTTNQQRPNVAAFNAFRGRLPPQSPISTTHYEVLDLRSSSRILRIHKKESTKWPAVTSATRLGRRTRRRRLARCVFFSHGLSDASLTGRMDMLLTP